MHAVPKSEGIFLVATRSVFACWLPFAWCHKLGWPFKGARKCTECGRAFVIQLS